MKKKKIGKKWILPLFILTLLAVNLILVSAETTFEKSAFFKFISPYFIPSGMEGIGGLIIGFVSLFILFLIFLDIFNLIPIFSRTTTKYIAVGLAIIMVVLKWNVTVAGWIFSVGASLFGFAGTAAVAVTIGFAIALLIALFIGGSFLDKVAARLRQIRTNRETLEDIDKAEKAGGKAAAIARAGEKFAENV